MVRIRLTKEEAQQAKEYSEKILASKRQNGSYGLYQMDSPEKYDHNFFIGTCGEMALCKYLKVEFIERLDQLEEYDLIYQGYKIDVKITHYKTGRLVFPQKEKFQADLAVLAYFSASYISLLGWISRDNFLKLAASVAKINGWCVEQRSLSPIGHLKELWPKDWNMPF